MRFLLDTCVVSDFTERQSAVSDRILALSPTDLAVSVITEMELAYGLFLNARIAERIKPIIERFFGAIKVLPFDRGTVEVTANLRARQKRRGRPVGAYDALIAGTALAHGLILVTSNTREFSQIEELRIENWRT